MSEKRIEENPVAPEDQPAETVDKTKDTVPNPVPDKTAPRMVPPPETKATTTVPLPVITPPVVAPRLSPMFTKTSPNDLYRRLLPAMLFVLTFVTVMTMLLIYMDTVALGAQKFRANMSRDYELASIAQGSAALVAFVQQLHLAPRHAAPPARPPPEPTPQIHALDQLYGEIYNGTFVEFVPRGPRSTTSAYLERARGWDGVLVRAAARDYLAIRGAARALHACLSPTAHPREVSAEERDRFHRVLCASLHDLRLPGEGSRLGRSAGEGGCEGLPRHQRRGEGAARLPQSYGAS
ncbi:hypothetical protein PYW07_010297 [Mythimna separata]|uniref:Uncharacterized protein n=1 Tax=Mythimna separata TaxID=271217 RepID=A0AAD7YH93_MYTSE|nr:hypothetical protein PYW07_010297 [Mythimna separata]